MNGGERISLWGRTARAVCLLLPVLAVLGGCGSATAQSAGGTFEPRTPERDRWSWNQHHARATAQGQLEWAPRPFAFTPGESVRYIDYEGGDDANDGLSTQTPWQHHPWDPNAAGQAARAQGVHTFVFKRGSVYRGSLIAQGSGTPDEPIRLTSDPDWGQGEAVIQGSVHVTGWTRGAAHPDIPQGERVWYADLDFAPRNVFVVDGEQVRRLHLARTPNWEVSDPDDPKSEWWTWDQPEWWRGLWTIETQAGPRHMGISKHFTEDVDHYVGAVLRTEYGNVMGTPYPTRVEAFEPAEDYVSREDLNEDWRWNDIEGRRGVVFQGMWYGDSTNIRENHRFYLEDKPHYLDSAGEFWFDRRDDGGGRLYVRLPDDRDPNTAQVEAARHIHLLQDRASHETPAEVHILSPEQVRALTTDGVSHLEVSGLSFRFTNTHWDLTLQMWGHEDVANGAIQFRGSGEGIRIANNTFEHVAMAVRVAMINDRCRMTDLEVVDNRISYLDHGAIGIADRGNRGHMGDVRILRNRLHEVGLRAYRNSHGHAITVGHPETMEIAGNVLTRMHGAGILVNGGKGSSSAADRPLARNLIYNNSVIDSLLQADDWGGIATWQGGPWYVYNNISGNPVGLKYTGMSRDGYAYYQDGGFKNYLFNNVAWGRPITINGREIPAQGAFYQAVPTILNHYFNNTLHGFAMGSGWSPAGGRQLHLGNVWMDIHGEVFNHGRQKEDAQAEYRDYLHSTIGYGHNVFRNVGSIGTLEGTGYGRRDTVEGFRAIAEEFGLWARDVGIAADGPLFGDSASRDYRPQAGSAVIDRGVRLFVPWGLSAMVGEWNFRRNNADPTVVIDEHWYMTPYHVDRFQYRNKPTYNLKAVNVTAEDYTQGPLEDWTDSALSFNGQDQYAFISHEEMTAPHEYRFGNEQHVVQGADLATPDIHQSNMLVEVYFRTEPGHTDGVLVAKSDGRAGYTLAVNGQGTLTFRLGADGQTHQIVSPVPVNDGQWRHVVAELDRQGGQARIYVDGRLTTEEAVNLPNGASLSNDGDLTVGRGPEGGFFAGEVDFLRIARGTFADARTSIEELYDWQFDGPFLRDFMGQEPTGDRRDAGAFEFVAD